MGENEWVILVPGHQDELTRYRLRPTGMYHHQLRQEGDDVWLSDAEALAFARQLPEVQALVEAVRAADLYLDHSKADRETGCVGYNHVKGLLRAALAALDGKEEDDGRE